MLLRLCSEHFQGQETEPGVSDLRGDGVLAGDGLFYKEGHLLATAVLGCIWLIFFPALDSEGFEYILEKHGGGVHQQRSKKVGH